MDYPGWRQILEEAIAKYKTPFYLFSWVPVEYMLGLLPKSVGRLKIRHFYSFKTTPLIPLIKKCNALGMPIEVVSEYEYLACEYHGVSPADILVNGPRKHDWLAKVKEGSWINIDSLSELPFIKTHKAEVDRSRIGIRVAVKNMKDPDNPQYSAQFGISANDVPSVLRELEGMGIKPQLVHFHLHSNVPSVSEFLEAIREISEVCAKCAWLPSVLDIGGGVPSLVEIERYGRRKTWEFSDLINSVACCLADRMPHIEELWLENGRFILAPAGVLAVSVRDVKKIGGCRYLICDGGRVNNALVSEWETRDIHIIPERGGENELTSICGPTCMAWDWLERKELPKEIKIGDFVIWCNAGAYHLPFETAFSHGLAAILWHDETGLRVVRGHQSLSDWMTKLGAGPYQ